MLKRLTIFLLVLFLSLTAVFAVNRTMGKVMDSQGALIYGCEPGGHCHLSAGKIDCLGHCLDAARPISATAQTPMLLPFLLWAAVFTFSLYFFIKYRPLLAVLRAPIPRDVKYLQTTIKRE